ncbi:MAG: NAD-dependent epimerase/dehydratase family protein [Pseudomonadota bacterium]
MSLEGRSIGQRSVLVIGAAGFLGQHVVTAVKAAGGTVLAYDRNPAPAGWSGAWTVAEAGDTAALKSAAQDATDVIYLAGRSRPAGGYDSLAREIDGEVATVVETAELCRDAGVGKFVFASSGGTVYGRDVQIPTAETEQARPQSSYGMTKLFVEHGLRLLSAEGPMQAAVLRISNPYGPGQRVKRQQGIIAAAMNAAMTGQPLEIWGDGSVVRDFVYVADVAEAFVAALACKDVYVLANIGSGQGVSIRDLCSEIDKVSDRPLKIDYLPDRKVDLPKAVLDPSRAARVLEWRPEVALADGLKKTYDWWAKQGDRHDG